MRWLVFAALVLVCGCDDKRESVDVSLSQSRIPISQMNDRQLAEWLSAQRQFPTHDTKRFTPTWSGFSVNPSGQLSYIDGGMFAIIFNEGAAKTGTADGTVMRFTGIPNAIRPYEFSSGICAVIFDDGSGGVQYPGVWGYNDAVGFGFGYLQVSSAPGTVVRQFTVPAGVAGLPAAWYIMYPTRE